MSLNIKLLFLFLLICGLSRAQEEKTPENRYFNDPETVFFNLEVFYPFAIGNSIYAEAYKLDPGYALDFNWFIRPNITVGVRYSFYRAYVKEVEKAGTISNSSSHLLGIEVGYHQNLKKEWNLHYKLGIGTLQNYHTAPEDSFNEEGGKLWITSDIERRLDKTFGLFFKAGLDYDFMHIKTSSAKDAYFNRNMFVNVGAGIRIHFQNPGG